MLAAATPGGGNDDPFQRQVKPGKMLYGCFPTAGASARRVAAAPEPMIRLRGTAAARALALRSRGFTLLEVVVALAIAGLALVGLFQAGSAGLFSVDTAARAEEAVERAQSHLAAVGRDAALVAGDSTGDDGGGYRWRLRVHPVTARQIPAAAGLAAQTTTLFSVEVAVSWRTRGRERSVVLRTLRLGSAAGSG